MEIEGQMMMLEVSEMVHEYQEKTYQHFTDKFKPTKTTDDCYTPQNYYDCLADFVAQEYGYDRGKFIRPFKPGGDYQKEQYPSGCAVVDNPPFSILAQICQWYQDHGIPFFLFGPTLTLIGHLRGDGIKNYCIYLLGTKVTYENGAVVNTNFITNMDKECCVRIEPELRARLETINDDNQRALHKQLPKYDYPSNVLTGADYNICASGKGLQIKRGQAVFIRQLDAQRQSGKTIFGSGLLLSDKAASAKQAGKIAAIEITQKKKTDDVIVWDLSEREKRIIDQMNKKETPRKTDETEKSFRERMQDN